MPKYIAVNDIWLSHENRLVRAGQEFETIFPKAKTYDGKEVDMRLGANIKLVDGEPAPLVDGDDIEDLRRIYEEIFGDKPHHNVSAKKLKEKIEERQKELGI